MAEYDKGRLYWIKLTDRFISSDTVDFLMSQKDGANYVVLYQMLCLKTVNNGGVLARNLGEVLVPYDVEKIQRDCKWFSIDTVRIALELYKKLGLIYENNDGVLAISEFDRLIGSQTYGAEKKELQKARRKARLIEGGTKVENLPPYKEKEKEKEKEKKKEKDKYTYKDVYAVEGENATATTAEEDQLKLVGGSLGKGVVCLSDRQLGHLMDVLGLDMFNRYVDRLATFIIDNNAHVKNHHDMILKWYYEDSQVSTKSIGKKKERYGNFDANEAMQEALKRNFFEEEENTNTEDLNVHL